MNQELFHVIPMQPQPISSMRPALQSAVNPEPYSGTSKAFNSDLLDSARVLELLGLNTPEEPNVFDELFDLFVVESNGQFHALRQSAAAGEFTQVRRIAHRLKGSSRSFGIPPLGDQCEMLEQLSDDASPEALERYIEQMTETFTLAVRALERYARRGA